jgi:hypothetical protein
MNDYAKCVAENAKIVVEKLLGEEPINEGRHRPGAWVVQTVHGCSVEDFADDGIMVIVGGTIETYTAQLNRRSVMVGIVGSGKEGSYGPVGSVVDIDNDRNANYQPLMGSWNKWKIIAYVQPSRENMKKFGIRTLYHFD